MPHTSVEMEPILMGSNWVNIFFLAGGPEPPEPPSLEAGRLDAMAPAGT